MAGTDQLLPEMAADTALVTPQAYDIDERITGH